MRFRLGKVPPDPGFDPNRGGWIKFREPNAALFWLLAIPLSIGLFLSTFIAIGSC